METEYLRQVVVKGTVSLREAAEQRDDCIDVGAGSFRFALP